MTNEPLTPATQQKLTRGWITIDKDGAVSKMHPTRKAALDYRRMFVTNELSKKVVACIQIAFAPGEGLP